MKRNRSARGYRSILWKAALLVFAGAAAIDLSAAAQDGGSSSGEASDSEPGAEPTVPDLPGHAPFTS